MSSIGSCQVPICMCSVPVQKLGAKVQVPVLVQAKTRNDQVEVFFVTVTNCFWYFCGRRWDKELAVNEGLPQAQICICQFCTGTAAVHTCIGITYGCWLCCGCTAHSQQDLESSYFSPGLPACWQDCSLFSNARWTTYVNWFFWSVFFRLSSEQLWRWNRTVKRLSPLGHPKCKMFEKIPTGPPGCFNKLLNSARSRWFSLYRNVLFGVHSNLFAFCPGHRGRIAFEDKLKFVAMSESFASRCMFKLWGILFAEFASQLLSHTGFYSSQCLEGRLSCQYAEELPSEKQQVGLVTNNELLKGGVFPKALILSLTPLWIQWKSSMLLMQTIQYCGKTYQYLQSHIPPLQNDNRVSSLDPRL